MRTAENLELLLLLGADTLPLLPLNTLFFLSNICVPTRSMPWSKEAPRVRAAGRARVRREVGQTFEDHFSF